MAEQVWDDREADGTLVAQHVRQDRDGFKAYYWRRNGKKGLAGLAVADLPLYRIEFLGADDTPILVEGEKAADALAARGYKALGTVTGAAAIPSGRSLRPLLACPGIFLWPDNDEPGCRHMERIAQRLHVLGKTNVWRVNWPDAPAKGDAADFLGSDEELATLFDTAEPWTHDPISQPAENQAGLATVVLVNLDDVAREEVVWRWTHRLPLGKLTGWIGDPEAGKSFSALAIAAAVTTGAPLPGDGNRWEPRKVLLLTAEDGLADTVRPRLEEMGANLRNVEVVNGIRDEQGRERFPSLVDHLAAIELELARGGYQLMILDPLNAYLGPTLDTHRDAALRSVLGPLAGLADRYNVAVLFVMHLTKGQRDRALYRAQGNIAYGAAARVVHLIGVNPDDQRERVIVPIKNNLAPKVQPIAFEIQDGHFLWRGETNVTVEALLAPDRSGEERSASKEANDFLLEALRDGPRPSKDVEQEAEAAGIAKATLRRAKTQLGVKSKARGEKGKEGVRAWLWELGARFELDAQASTYKHVEHLTNSTHEAVGLASAGEHLNGHHPNPLVQLALEELPDARIVDP